MNKTALAFDFVDKKTKHSFHIPLSVFKRPMTKEEYIQLELLLDNLIDTVRDDEKHPLALVMQIIGENLEQYDNEHYPGIGVNVSPIEMVRYIMDSNHLRQKDLADIFGSQSNVSKFLNGERELGKTHILALKRRFGISSDFFLT